jgi:hypothetical protein
MKKFLLLFFLTFLQAVSWAVQCSIELGCFNITDKNAGIVKKNVEYFLGRPKNGAKILICDALDGARQCLNSEIEISARWTMPPFLPTRINLSSFSFTSRNNVLAIFANATYASNQKTCTSNGVSTKVVNGKFYLLSTASCSLPVVGAVVIDYAFDVVQYLNQENALLASYSIDVSGGLTGTSVGFGLIKFENFEDNSKLVAINAFSSYPPSIEKNDKTIIAETKTAATQINLVAEELKPEFMKHNQQESPVEQSTKQLFNIQTNKVARARALVVGNSNYPGINKLKNPENDARAISQKLRELGFDVDEVINGNRSALVNAFSNFEKKSKESDISLLYYAGHGAEIAGVNYILPIDINMSDLTQVPLEGVSLSSVVEQYLPGKTKLVFLDACRDNPLMQTRSRGGGRGLAPITVSEGTLISYATKDGQIALDGNGKNSPFTTALLEHLGDKDDIAVVLRKVRESVMKSTGGKQQPWEYGSLTGGALILSDVNSIKN